MVVSVTNSHTTYFIWLHSSLYKIHSLVRVIFLAKVTWWHVVIRDDALTMHGMSHSWCRGYILSVRQRTQGSQPPLVLYIENTGNFKFYFHDYLLFLHPKRALPQVEFSLVLSIMGTYSIDMHALFFSNRSHGCFVVVFRRFHQAFGGSDAMVTAMVRLVGFVSRIVARMIAHRYV